MSEIKLTQKQRKGMIIDNVIMRINPAYLPESGLMQIAINGLSKMSEMELGALNVLIMSSKNIKIGKGNIENGN